jgi:predicted transposase YbfD/YdcC
MRELLGLSGEIVAIDGKTIRSTYKGSGFRDKLHIVTAYMTANGVCLGQLAVEEKTNEIPIVRELVGMIDIKGKIVTMDAMHCQTETARGIIDGGGDYVIGLKANQKTLHEDVTLYMADCVNAPGINVETAYTMEKNGDRVEKRICHTAPDISWIDGKDEWEGLKSVFSICRKVSVNGKQSEETSYYMTSLCASCDDLLSIVREHWKIESMHWMLDVVFSEDECRIFSANGQKSMNVFRKLAIALHQCDIAGLKQKTKPSVRKNMRHSLMDDQRLLKVICCPVSPTCNNP